MDALSDVLRVIKIDSAIFLNGEFSEPWCVSTPESCALAPMLARGPGQVIIYHLLCEGRAHVQLPDGSRIALSAGDLITFPHGHEHVLGAGPRMTPTDLDTVLPSVLEAGLELIHVGGGGVSSRFICGFLVCDPQLTQTFFGGLPPMIKVSLRDDVTTAAGEALANVVEHAYACSGERSGRDLTLLARVERGGKLCVDVSDRGSFLRRKPLPGRGFGLRIIRAIAGRMRIDTSRGTCVSMTFRTATRRSKS